jgi:hypothetical protein
MKAFRCTDIVPDAFRVHKETAYRQRHRQFIGFSHGTLLANTIRRQ